MAKVNVSYVNVENTDWSKIIIDGVDNEIIVDNSTIARLVAEDLLQKVRNRNGSIYVGRKTLQRWIIGTNDRYLRVTHNNGIYTDNRVSNLVVRTYREYSKLIRGGITKRKGNKTGAENVYWLNDENRYMAKITRDGKQYTKRANTIEEAIEAVKELKAKINKQG